MRSLRNRSGIVFVVLGVAAKLERSCMRGRAHTKANAVNFGGEPLLTPRGRNGPASASAATSCAHSPDEAAILNPLTGALS
jgi:hypothetical protein